MMRNQILLVVAALVVGGMIGWFVGRALLEKQWSNPVSVVTAADYKRAAIEGADATPKEGAKIMRPVPLKRLRAFLAGYTEKDPVQLQVGAVGRGGDNAELHLVIRNLGKCRVKRLAGVAYGYDARGRAATINKGGENYAAFESEEGIDPGGKAMVSVTIHTAPTASLALAHVDEVDCADGSKWRRG